MTTSHQEMRSSPMALGIPAYISEIRLREGRVAVTSLRHGNNKAAARLRNIDRGYCEAYKSWRETLKLLRMMGRHPTCGGVGMPLRV